MNAKMIPSRTVFISSTTSDLVRFRQAAIDIIKQLNEAYLGRYSLAYSCMDVEANDGERRPAVERSRKWVSDADWFVLIVARHYGFMPELDSQCQHEQWEPCSVTEWEYHQAVTVCKPAKKCFVYMAGGEEDGDYAYRPAADPNQEPLRPTEKESEEHIAKLKRFRAILRNTECHLFPNIETFRKDLENDFCKVINKEIGTSPVPAILALLEPYLFTVKTLATLKRIHDCLHRIRQYGIRRVREEVLATWQEGNDTARIEIAYLKCMTRIVDYIGAITGHFAALDKPLQASLPSIPRVMGHFHKHEIELPSSHGELSRDTNDFASRVQMAFSACNLRMQKVADQLREQFRLLMTEGNKLIASGALNQEWVGQLRGGLVRITALHDSLQTVLSEHNNWQRFHDSLQRIDDACESDSFDLHATAISDMAQDIQDSIPPARRMTEREGSRDLSPLFDKVEATLGALLECVNSAENIAPSNRFEYATTPEVEQRAGDESLSAGPTRQLLPAYDAMRKNFDDLFFQIDLETLRTVEEAEAHAIALKEDTIGMGSNW